MSTSIKKNWKQLLLKNFVLIILIAFILFMSFQRRSFRSWMNITTILNDCCMYGIAALGMTLCVIVGDVDLSVSSVYAWSACLFCILCNSMSVLPAFLITLISGAFWGSIVGMLVSLMRMPAFVASLGMMYTVKGLAYWITAEKPINTTNEQLKLIGGFNIAEISIVPIVFLLVFIILYWFMKYTKLGREIYATGGNYDVARLSGINVRLTKLIPFIILGACSALSGMCYASRIYSGAATYGSDLTIWCVASVVIGGTSMAGGSGGVSKTLIGILFMAVLFNALTLMGVDGSMQRFIRGFVLIVVIVFDVMLRIRKVNSK